MKTTIDLPEPLLSEIKRLATRRDVTVKQLVEQELRRLVASEKDSATRYELPDGSVDGHGVQPGIREGDWQQVRGLIYEGHGG